MRNTRVTARVPSGAALGDAGACVCDVRLAWPPLARVREGQALSGPWRVTAAGADLVLAGATASITQDAWHRDRALHRASDGPGPA